MDKTRKHARAVAQRVREWLNGNVINTKLRVVGSDNALTAEAELHNEGTLIGSTMCGSKVTIGKGAYVEGLSCGTTPESHATVTVGEDSILVGVNILTSCNVHIGKGVCLLNCSIYADVSIGDNSTLVNTKLFGPRGGASYIGANSVLLMSVIDTHEAFSIGNGFTDIGLDIRAQNDRHCNLKIWDNVLFVHPLMSLFPFALWHPDLVLSESARIAFDLRSKQRTVECTHDFRWSPAAIKLAGEVNIFNDCIVYMPGVICTTGKNLPFVMNVGAVLGWAPKRLGLMFTTGAGPLLLADSIRIGSHGVLIVGDSPEKSPYGAYYEENNRVSTIVINDYGKCILALRNKTGEYIVGKNGITYGG